MRAPLGRGRTWPSSCSSPSPAGRLPSRRAGADALEHRSQDGQLTDQGLDGLAVRRRAGGQDHGVRLRLLYGRDERSGLEVQMRQLDDLHRLAEDAHQLRTAAAVGGQGLM